MDYDRYDWDLDYARNCDSYDAFREQLEGYSIPELQAMIEDYQEKLTNEPNSREQQKIKNAIVAVMDEIEYLKD